MLKNLIKTSYKNMNREEWLAFRRGSIGGSEAAALVGLSKWASPFSVWADKLGMTEAKPENEAMRIGKDLEEYVAKRWSEATGKKVRRENNFLINPQYPFAHATVDRLVIGEDAGLECKTTSRLNVKRFKGVEFPEEYYVQCVHYLACVGCARWHLAVLVLGEGFYEFTLERDEEEIAALMAEEERFWTEYVLAKKSPVADGSEATTEAINEIYPSDNGERVDLTFYNTSLARYTEVSAQISELSKVKDGIANEIKNYLGEYEGGDSDRYRVSWKGASRSTFDTKRFAADHPYIDLSGYYKTSSYRTFKVTEITN